LAFKGLRDLSKVIKIPIHKNITIAHRNILRLLKLRKIVLSVVLSCACSTIIHIIRNKIVWQNKYYGKRERDGTIKTIINYRREEQGWNNRVYQ